MDGDEDMTMQLEDEDVDEDQDQDQDQGEEEQLNDEHHKDMDRDSDDIKYSLTLRTPSKTRGVLHLTYYAVHNDAGSISELKDVPLWMLLRGA